MVMQTYAVVHGGAVCVLRTRHISRVLKFFLHLSQTAKRASGYFTLSVCLKPGGVKVKMFPCDVACGNIICLESVLYVEYGGKDDMVDNLATPRTRNNYNDNPT
mmetsp:Transcript_9704/g.18570  ORF Transcript_9704/g.18570 Transcript_9704/m.18570 type:complete len:104 (-) Transcript_9704:57-368(-)